MLFSTFFLAAIPLTLARPTGHEQSLRSPISKRAMGEIGRLARAVNAAYCPEHHQRPPILRLQPRSRDYTVPQPPSHLVISSRQSEYSNAESALDMSWYISHAPSTQTLTLAYSSLPEVEDLIDLLAYPEDPEQPLVPLPDYILANRTIDEMPRIHSSYLYPLEDFGLPGLLSLLDVLEDNAPEPSPKGLMRYIRSAPAPEHPIKRVDIIGHGLGAAMGLLVSLALEEMTNAISIHTTLFGLPRVGDQAFARLVDDSHSDRLDIKRVTSFKDSITHFPETHLGLVHPSKGEIWVSSDPRTAYSCRAVEGENEACGGSVELGKSSLMDHQGPYGGVWVGSQSCQSRS